MAIQKVWDHHPSYDDGLMAKDFSEKKGCTTVDK
jgi:hypothetical protein